MSALGQKQTCAAQKVMSALTPKAVEIADIVCGEGIVHINAAIPRSALYLSVTKQKLNGAQIAAAPIDQCRREERASCKAVSAFTVAIRCKADMAFCAAHVCF